MFISIQGRQFCFHVYSVWKLDWNWKSSSMYLLMQRRQYVKNVNCKLGTRNKNKGKGDDAGLAWESQSHCFADEFVITHVHSFGTDTQHDYSQGNCRIMLSIIIISLNNE